MKKIFLTISLILCAVLLSNTVKAQYKTELLMTDVPAGVYQLQVEHNIGLLLTEFNNAQHEGRELRLNNISLNDQARSTLTRLWDNAKFRCLETEIIEACLGCVDGYQVRNIPLNMYPYGSEPEYQEAVISFDASGRITNFHIAANNIVYANIIKSNIDLTDLRQRYIILDYVEQFRTSYNTKDINFLKQIFSEDALIITGKVIESVKMADLGVSKVKNISYSKQSKEQYIRNLTGLFSRNKRIKVIFDDIEIKLHPAKKGVYGVTLKQYFSSDSYSDVGYLFLLWDFRGESPKIHVRTWQPNKIGEDEELPESEIFTINDFDIADVL